MWLVGGQPIDGLPIRRMARRARNRFRLLVGFNVNVFYYVILLASLIHTWTRTQSSIRPPAQTRTVLWLSHPVRTGSAGRPVRPGKAPPFGVTRGRAPVLHYIKMNSNTNSLLKQTKILILRGLQQSLNSHLLNFKSVSFDISKQGSNLWIKNIILIWEKGFSADPLSLEQ